MVKQTHEKRISKSIVGSGVAGPGRPKGSVNKTTKAAKDAIAEAAEALGGVDRLVSWAREDALNERAFWATIYPKLLPLQIAGDAENPLVVITKIELVAPNGNG